MPRGRGTLPCLPRLVRLVLGTGHRSQSEHLVPPADGAAAHPLLPQLYYPQALSICEVMAPFYAWAS